MQTSYIIIKSKAIYSRNLGKIIHAFESKGLTLRVTKFFENSGPQVFTIWEGSESETITKKIANSINPEFFEFPLKENLKNYLTEDDLKYKETAMVPSFSCKINNEEISFKYPCITYSFMSEVSSVPLGLLKTFIDTNFEG